MAKAKSRSRSAKKPEAEEVFFVEVKNQGDLRVNTLESMKLLIRLMKDAEDYKTAKHEKESAISGLRSEFKEISRIVSDFKSSLPPVRVRAPVVPKPQVPTEEKQETLKSAKKAKPKKAKAKPKKTKAKKKAHKKTAKKARPKAAAKKAPPKPKGVAELQKLESELTAIEEKLGTLG
tara:strand:- start:33270 stop:33800 length:531 start_codon:yes stop_codon:yes gene_type:complete